MFLTSSYVLKGKIPAGWLTAWPRHFSNLVLLAFNVSGFSNQSLSWTLSSYCPAPTGQMREDLKWLLSRLQLLLSVQSNEQQWRLCRLLLRAGQPKLPPWWFFIFLAVLIFTDTIQRWRHFIFSAVVVFFQKDTRNQHQSKTGQFTN